MSSGAAWLGLARLGGARRGWSWQGMVRQGFHFGCAGLASRAAIFLEIHMNNTDAGFVLLLFSAVIYFLPAFIALMRGHQSGCAIFVLNFFLGWTLVGWVLSLVWSLTAPSRPAVVIHNSNNVGLGIYRGRPGDIVKWE
jgi:hypothetical protein